MAKEVFDGERRRGWAVEGSPADCVKLAVAEFCPKPDLIVSGINGGLNLGINVLYSGTVAGATEGAVFGLTSIAVSLEYDEHAQFDQAAEMAVRLIEQILERSRRGVPTACTISISRPSHSSGRRRFASCRWRPSVGRPSSIVGLIRRVAATTGRWERRRCPRGRTHRPGGLGTRLRDAHAAADRSDRTRDAGADAGLEVDVEVSLTQRREGAKFRQQSNVLWLCVFA